MSQYEQTIELDHEESSSGYYQLNFAYCYNPDTEAMELDGLVIYDGKSNTPAMASTLVIEQAQALVTAWLDNELEKNEAMYIDDANEYVS